jgi:chromosome segregation ATPase
MRRSFQESVLLRHEPEAPQPTLERLLLEVLREIREPKLVTDEFLNQSIHHLFQLYFSMDKKLDLVLKRENTLMALSNEELAAIQDLSSDIDAALAAATGHDATLQAVIDDLTAQRDALAADDASDKAQIDSLTDSVNSLQAALNSHSADVVAALTDLDSKVTSATPATA